MKIIYNCSKVCGKLLTFYNKCSFFNHIKSHINISSTINLLDLYVTPLAQTSINITYTPREDEETISMQTFEYLKKYKLIDIKDEVLDNVSSVPSFFKQTLKPLSNIDAITNSINSSFDNALKENESCGSFLQSDMKFVSLSNELFGRSNQSFTQSKMQVLIPSESFIQLNEVQQSGTLVPSIQSKEPASYPNMTLLPSSRPFLQSTEPTAHSNESLSHSLVPSSEAINLPNVLDSSQTSITLLQPNEPIVKPKDSLEQTYVLPSSSNNKKIIIKQIKNIEIQPAKKQVTVIANMLIKSPRKDSNSEQNDHQENSEMETETLIDKTIPPKDDCCPFCSHKYQDGNLAKAQEKHFQLVKCRITCHECKLYFMNKCSFQAHKTVHTFKPPFICPECGHKFYALYFFYKHIHGVCFHLSKVSVIPCPIKLCKAYFLQSLFPKHFISCHISSFFKCSLCQRSFIDENLLSDHAKEIHDNEDVQSLKHFRCIPCGELFQTLDEIKTHFQKKHDKISTLKQNVLKCPGCNKKFLTVVALRKHIGDCAPYKNSKYGKYLDRSENSGGKFKYNSIELPSNFISNKCTKCKVISIQDASADNSEDIFCIKCSTDNEKTTHVRIGNKSKRKIKILEIENHLQPKRKSENQNDKIFFNKQLLFNADGPPKSTSGNSNFFTCKMCQFNSEDRAVFTDHIISHRDESAAYQCMDCGICYVVKPSLSKHLTTVHNIFETEQYMETHQSKIVACFERLEKVKLASTKNQCTECMETFQNASDLDKHFRSHGMAFIMSKQKNKSP